MCYGALNWIIEGNEYGVYNGNKFDVSVFISCEIYLSSCKYKDFNKSL